MLKFFKSYWPYLFIIIVGLFFFSSTLSYDFTDRDWVHFETTTLKFPGKLPILQVPLKYYFDQYGWFWISVVIVKMIFGTNALLYFLLSLTLRIAASISIYKLVKLMTENKVSSIIAALFFLLSLGGIETTIWVTQFIVYIIVIMLAVAFYYWLIFHQNPTSVNFKRSIILYLLTIWFTHIRAYAFPLIIILGDIYFRFFKKDNNNITWKTKHLFFSTASFLFLYIFTEMMKTTPELAGKIISPKVLVTAIMSGYPPIIHSFMLFLGSTITHPDIFNFSNALMGSYFTQQTVSSFVGLSLLVGALLAIFLILKKSSSFFVLLLPGMFYPVSVVLSYRNLTGWNPSWLSTNIIGGTFIFYYFILSLSLLKSNQKISQLILLGLLISVSHLLIPWMGFTMPESNEQSAFDFMSRYYTIPVFGAALIYGAFSDLLLKKLIDTKAKLFYKTFSLILLVITLIFPALSGYELYNFIQSSKQLYDSESRKILTEVVLKEIGATDKSANQYLYVENSLDPIERTNLTHYVSATLYVSHGFRNSQNTASVYIFDDKLTLENYKKDPEIYNSLKLYTLIDGELKEI